MPAAAVELFQRAAQFVNERLVKLEAVLGALT